MRRAKDFRKDRPPTTSRGKENPAKRPASRGPERPENWIYGLHAVGAALANPRRKLHRALLTARAAETLGDKLLGRVRVEPADAEAISRLLPPGAVHQGAALSCDPLPGRDLETILVPGEAGRRRIVLVLDQLSDPHNVGAIMRSAVAFGAGALVTTARHSPQESGVLAKSASGALEHIDLIEVRNLADALGELHEAGFQTIGLDSEAPADLENSFSGKRIALVLGAEGKGLRQKSRETVTTLARLDMPGVIHSLNVSNAAAIALYAARRHLAR